MTTQKALLEIELLAYCACLGHQHLKSTKKSSQFRPRRKGLADCALRCCTRKGPEKNGAPWKIRRFHISHSSNPPNWGMTQSVPLPGGTDWGRTRSVASMNVRNIHKKNQKDTKSEGWGRLVAILVLRLEKNHGNSFCICSLILSAKA